MRRTRSVELCVGGLPAAYFRVSGHTFERKGPAGRLSYAETQQLQTMGAVPDYDPKRDDAEIEWAWERWEGTLERRDASVVRVSDAVHRWMLGQLAIVRERRAGSRRIASPEWRSARMGSWAQRGSSE